MAIILQFRRDAESLNRSQRSPEGPLGEIIIFPGVRIERRVMGPAQGPVSTPPRRRAQRSRKK